VGGLPYIEEESDTYYIGNDYIFKDELISSICDYDGTENLLIRMDMLFSIGIVDRAINRAMSTDIA
tara:strand:+ start:1317 stop:1514 length:198 start_codon:yes stop_codon:yes gene_type:complete